MSYLQYKLGPIAKRIVASDGCQLLIHGDSTTQISQDNRWAESLRENWATPIAGQVLYDPLPQQTGAGWNTTYNGATSYAAGTAMPDGTVVPPGFLFAAFREFTSDRNSNNSHYRLRATRLNSYALGNPFDGQTVRVTSLLLDTANPANQARVRLHKDGDANAADFGEVVLPTQAVSPGAAQFRAYATPDSLFEDGQDDWGHAFWGSNVDDETGKSLAIGGGHRVEAVGKPGLVWGSFGVGGDTLKDLLPDHLVPGNRYSTAERTAKFDLLGYPDVILFSVGINLETDANTPAEIATWKTRYQQLLDWHNAIYQSSRRASPYFLLFVPWQTPGDVALRRAQEQVVRELCDENPRIGALNGYRLFQAEHGSWDDWKAAYLDGIEVHMTESGAGELGRMTWEQIELAAAAYEGVAEAIHPPHELGNRSAGECVVAGAAAGEVLAL